VSVALNPERLAAFEAKYGKAQRKKLKSRPAKRVVTAEQAFAEAWAADPLPGVEMVAQHKFHPDRGWAFDFAWPAAKLAVELEGFGSGFTVGRHQTYAGFREDCVKYNSAVTRGWRLLRFPSGDKREVADWLRTVKLALCGMEE
jgi:very-short-patch-repair endonuclease